MLGTILLSSVTILGLSYAIVLYAKKNYLQSEDTTNYLFGNNNIFLAISSNTGSILSLTVLIMALIPAVIGWGYTPIYGLFAGIIGGYWFFYFSMKKLRSTGVFNNEFKFYTIPEISNHVDTIFFNRLQFILYGLTITFELGVFRHLLDILLTESGLINMGLVYLVTLLCATYVSVGGYVGVLRTDLFQLVIFLIGFIIIVFNLEPEQISAVFSDTLVSEYFVPNDFLMFWGTLIVVFAYHFGWPDLLVRNITTLGSNLQKTSKALYLSVIGLIIIVIPPLLLALSYISKNGGIDKIVDVDKSLALIASSLGQAEILSNNYILWWVIGSIICILITSLDTWLIGFMQHKKRSKNIDELKYAPFGFGTIACLVSFFLTPQNLYFLGVLALNILLINSASIVQKVLFPKIAISKGVVVFCYVQGVIFLLVFTFILGIQLDRNTHVYTLWQTIITLFIILFIPVIINSRSKANV